MKKLATLHTYLEAADTLLLSRGVEYRYEPYLHKALFIDDTKEKIRNTLNKTNILFFYSAGYDDWTDILIQMHQEEPFPIKLMIFGGTDLILFPEYMEIYEAFFSNTEFWVINFIGTTEKTKLIPLLFNWDGVKEFQMQKKEKIVGIPFAHVNSTARLEFFNQLKELPNLHPYIMKKMASADYYSSMSSLYFCVCCMGNGPDTFRFWEALVCGAIPIVIRHEFFECLMYHYPEIPVIVIESLADLELLIPKLTVQEYNERMEKANLDILWEEYWIAKFRNYQTVQH